MAQLRRYLRKTGGNISMMFALAFLVIFMGAGVVFDSLGMTKEYRHSQHLADMAVLAAATSGEQEIDDLQQIAEETIDFNVGIQNDYTTVVTITAENAIQVEVSKTYEMQFMGVFGHENKAITALAEAPPKGMVNLT